MNKERIETIEKLVGKVVLRSGMLIVAVTLSNVMFDKIERDYLKNKN